jgi:NADPH2:quinone reductase
VIPGEFIGYQAWYHEEPCKILGEDFVGEVVESRSNAFKPGEKVAASHSGAGKAFDGSYAEFVLAHERRLWHLPQNSTVPWEVLGALGMPFITAWQSLMVAGRLAQRPKGAVVLVRGATSAVGVFSMLLRETTERP